MRKFDWGRLSPKFWFQNSPTSWEWDEMLNHLLDEQTKIELGYLTITLAGIEVWVGNYPYAYGSPYRPEVNVLPSVATRKRLRAAIDPFNELREKFEGRCK